jgi:hypothetical protein
VTTLTQHLDVVVAMYHDQAIAAAEAESEYKKARATRFLLVRRSGEAKSVADADAMVESDDTVADLYTKRLVASAMADSTKQKILSLREQIGYERSMMADRRAQDQFHANDPRVT